MDLNFKFFIFLLKLNLKEIITFVKYKISILPKLKISKTLINTKAIIYCEHSKWAEMV